MRRLLLILLSLQGVACSGHYAHAMKDVHQLARDGEPEAAYEALRQRTDGTDWDPLLVALDEGALLHRAGRWQQSADALNRAIAIADDRETVSLSEELWGRAPFRMSKYEKQALHAMQAINYLQLGQLDDALVEARLTDLRQGKLAREVARSRDEEHFMLGNTVDERQRAFFERLTFGRFISAVAWELEGHPDAAFIDYYRAWQLARSSPADANVGSANITPNLLRLANELQRPEADELRRLLGEPEPPLGSDGQLVVIVEAGFGPELVLDEKARAYAFAPVPRSTAPGYVIVSGQPQVPEPLSSIEEQALRKALPGGGPGPRACGVHRCEHCAVRGLRRPLPGRDAAADQARLRVRRAHGPVVAHASA